MNINLKLADLLKNHGLSINIDDEYIQSDLPDKVRFKASTVFAEIGNSINSRLDVTAVTNKGEQIFESFGDVGNTIEDAVNSNFKNFSNSSLHPMLAALGSQNQQVYDQITMEEWEINGRFWNAYIGNLVPKFVADIQNMIYPPAQFYATIEAAIRSQRLTNRLHWFRGYYSQVKNEITNTEFLMDNEPLTDTNKIFESLPIISNVHFYSCRIFIVLKNKASG